MQQPATVLLVDDDEAVREVCHEALADAGHDVVEAATGAGATAEIRPGRFDAAIVDLRLEDADGMQVVAALRAADAETCVVVMTGYAELDSAVNALKQGVYDYLRKPFDAEHLARIVDRGLERRRLAAENRRLLRELQDATRRLLAHKKRLEEKIEVATEELGSLIDLGRQMASTVDPDRLLALILERACALSSAAGGHILQAEGDAGLIARASRGGYMAAAEPGTAGLVLRLAADAVAFARTVMDNDLGKDGPPRPWPPGHPSSVLVVPIVVRGQVTGAVCLYDKTIGPFTADDADLVNVLAVQAAGILAAPTAPEQPHGTAAGAGTWATDEFVPMEDLLKAP